MIKKKILLAGVCMACVIMTGCTPNETVAPVQEEPAAQETQQEAQEGSVSKADEAKDASSDSENMGNPIVEVADANAFESELGMKIDVSMLPAIERFAIIGGKMAEMDFGLTSVDGDPINCVFRATKDVEMSDMMHGIYDTDLVDGSTIEYSGSNGTANVNYVRANTEKSDIWTWSFNDAFYSFTMDNDASQMTIAAILDSLMVASGVDTPSETDNSGNGVTVAPLHEEIDLSNLGDRMILATLLPDSMKKADDGITADFELYTMDIYDAVEMTTLKPGDTIIVDSEPILVESIEDNGSIVINGGIENGGAEFTSNGGGTFRYFGFDDYATYTDRGKVNLTINKDTVIMDYSDPENAEGIQINPEEFMDFVNNPANNTSFTYGNTTIRTEGGKLVEITRKYVP